MTSSSEQPHKEYVITEFQLKQLQDFASLEFVCQAIRKRQHPVPAQRYSPEYMAKKIQGVKDLAEFVEQASKEHDAAIARKACEKTLTEVYDAMISSPEIRGDCMRDAIRVVNSLRTTTPHTEQEQPR